MNDPRNTAAFPSDLSERFPDLTFHKVHGWGSWYGVDSAGVVRVTACGSNRESDYDRLTRAQDEIETGSQVVSADDEYA